MSNSSKKVALLLHDLEEGGMQVVCLKLMQALNEHPNLELELVLSNQAGDFLNRVPDNISLINLAIPFQLCLKYVYHLTIALSQYLRRSKPDVILSNLPFVNLITLLSKILSFSQVSTILVEHTLPLERSLQHEGDNKLSQRFTSILTVMTRILYPYADHIVTPSHGMAKELSQAIGLKGYQLDKLKAVYNPVVDCQLFQKAQQVLEHPWFQPNQPPVILAVGRLTVQKDYTTLLQAFALLRKEMPARLVILGDGPMRAQLEALITTLNIEADVDLPGFVDNPYGYMSRSSVFVLSSVWETFGVVLVEALACGCPVISTDCDYGPAEVLDNGEYGSLVPVKDTYALSQAMKAVLTTSTHDPQKLKERAQSFSLEQSANQYLSMMEVSMLDPKTSADISQDALFPT
ncbi:MAG: glycosyltransferase [Cyanobacteria bacterium J06649_12]